MIRIEERGKLLKLLCTIMDRGSLNLDDTSTCIRPKTMLLAGRDVAFFFDKFEKLKQVTIIQQSSPGFYETVRMAQPLLAQLSPRMIVQDIAGQRLFMSNKLSLDMGQHSDQTQPEPTPMPETICGQPLTLTGPSVATIGTVTTQDSSQELLPTYCPLLAARHCRK